MRERWEREAPAIRLEAGTVRRIIQAAFPGATVTGWATLPGGIANTNVKVTLEGGPGPAALIRLWQKDPRQAGVEIAVLRRLAGHVPVPLVFAFTETDPELGLPCAVLEWTEGECLDTALSPLSRSREREGPNAQRWEGEGPAASILPPLAHALGRTLAAIHAITFDRPGYFDPALHVHAAAEFGAGALHRWLVHCLLDGRGAARLGERLTAEALGFAVREGHRLETGWAARPCLTHADFNPSNLLVRREEGGWCVAAVLDWECALSGAPALDFGNLIRPPLGECPGFAEALADGYRAGGRELPEDWQQVARIADLFAWADFLNRPNAGDALIADAREMVGRILSGG